MNKTIRLQQEIHIDLQGGLARRERRERRSEQTHQIRVIVRLRLIDHARARERHIHHLHRGYLAVLDGTGFFAARQLRRFPLLQLALYNEALALSTTRLLGRQRQRVEALQNEGRRSGGHVGVRSVVELALPLLHFLLGEAVLLFGHVVQVHALRVRALDPTKEKVAVFRGTERSSAMNYRAMRCT